MDKVDFAHKITLATRWSDLDALGHVNNATFFSYLEMGRVDYCENILDLQFNPDTKASWVLADIQCSYLQQIHFPQDIEVCTRFSKLGNKSATLTAHIYQKGENKPAATSEGIVVWFDFKTQQSERIPDAIREAITGYEKSVDVD